MNEVIVKQSTKKDDSLIRLVTLFGEIEDPSFVFQIDKPIYLYNNGIIGQTYNPNNQCCKILGYATKTNQFYITIQPTIGL